MHIDRSGDYDEMAASYQCLEIARLNEILKRHGIEDLAMRREICTDYFFFSGNFLDCGWLKAEGRTLWPELCFAERTLDPEHGLGEIETLHVAERFAFHEFAHGDIDWYFDDHDEDASEIESSESSDG